MLEGCMILLNRWTLLRRVLREKLGMEDVWHSVSLNTCLETLCV